MSPVLSPALTPAAPPGARAAVLYVLGWLQALLALVMLFPIPWAAFYGEPDALYAFLGAAMFTAFAGGGQIMAFRGAGGSGAHALTRVQTCLILALAWGVLPVYAALPFAAGGMAPLDAYFEAVSGLTTTGATVLLHPEEAPRALLVWRAVLQWTGGMGTLVTLAAVLAPMGAGGLELHHHQNLARGEGEDLVQRMRQAAQIFLAPYGLFTLACLALLITAGVPSFHALCLSFSTVSTGGFQTVSPGAASVEAALLHAPAVRAILVPFMALGALGFAGHAALVWGRRRPWYGAETRWFLILALGAAGALAIMLHGQEPRAPELWSWVTAAGRGLFIAVSLLSTTGIGADGASSAGGAGGAGGVPPVPVMALVLIGGAALSTAGGIKIMRFILMLKQGGRELRRLAYPSGVWPLQFSGRAVSMDTMGAVWVYFAAFVFCLGLTAVALSWIGLSFDLSLNAAAAAIANAGPALDYLHPGAYAHMPAAAKAVLAAAMLAGRIELLALMGLLTPANWRR